MKQKLDNLISQIKYIEENIPYQERINDYHYKELVREADKLAKKINEEQYVKRNKI